MTNSTWIFYLFVAFVKPGNKITHNVLSFAIIYFFRVTICYGVLSRRKVIVDCQSAESYFITRFGTVHFTTRMHFRSYPSFLKELCPTVS